MSKKVVVTITETKRAKEDQPWKVRIEKPRAEPIELPRRYSRLDAARRGAIRNLKAQRSPVTGEWFVPYKSGAISWIEFVIKRRK